MATATEKSPAAIKPASRAARARVPKSGEFVIFEDNGGSYHWRVVAGDGAPLAQSGGFACYEDAEQGARRVRDAAGSPLLERQGTGAPPVDLVARRAALEDNADAERWLDEGGSFSSEAVARWPAPC